MLENREGGWRIDRGLGGGAADEPIFACFAVMINGSD